MSRHLISTFINYKLKYKNIYQMADAFVLPDSVRCTVYVCECGFFSVDRVDVYEHETSSGHTMVPREQVWVKDEYHMEELKKAANGPVHIERITNNNNIKLVMPRSLLNDETAELIRPKLVEMGLENPYDIVNKVFPELFADPVTEMFPNKQNPDTAL